MNNAPKRKSQDGAHEESAAGARKTARTETQISLTEEQLKKLVATALATANTDMAVAVIKAGIQLGGNVSTNDKQERDLPTVTTDRDPVLTEINCPECQALVFKDDSATILATNIRAVLRTPRNNNPTEYWGDFPLLTRPAYDNYNNLK